MEPSIKYLIPVFANFTRFLVIAGIPFLIFYIIAPQKFKKQKIQKKATQRKDWSRELRHSFASLLIFSTIAILIAYTPIRGFTQLYMDIHAYPIWWIPISIFLGVVIQDTYFYWLHRAMHHKKLYRHFHLVHHQSVNPTPFTSHSFNISESVLEALVIPIILCLVPMHLVSIISFIMFALSFNVYGHLGYEIAPKWFRRSFLFQIMNTSVHHNLHHEKFHGNYGYYFRIWDRLMGTENPNYVKKYDEIQERRFGKSAPASFSWKKVLPIFLLVIFSTLTMSATVPSKGIEGKWKYDDKNAVILIYKKEALYFGKLIDAGNKADNKKLKEHGEVIVLNHFKKINQSKYCCGTIFAPKIKQTFSGTLIQKNSNELRVDGTLGFLTKSDILKRLPKS